jgi:hypothetical protein
MSIKLKTVMVMVMLAGAGLLAGSMPGCGSSSSSGSNVQALCMKSCDKASACIVDAGLGGGITLDCTAQCKVGADGGIQENCTNEAAIESAINACLAMTNCAAYLGCISTNVPDCQTAGGGNGG